MMTVKNMVKEFCKKNGGKYDALWIFGHNTIVLNNKMVEGIKTNNEEALMAFVHSFYNYLKFNNYFNYTNIDVFASLPVMIEQYKEFLYSKIGSLNIVDSNMEIVLASKETLDAFLKNDNNDFVIEMISKSLDANKDWQVENWKKWWNGDTDIICIDPKDDTNLFVSNTIEISRDTRMSMKELREYIKEAAKKGSGEYKIVINNTDELCKWGIDNNEETIIIICNEEHETLGTETLFSAYVNNIYVKGKIEYFDWGAVGVYPTENNINPFVD